MGVDGRDLQAAWEVFIHRSFFGCLLRANERVLFVASDDLNDCNSRNQLPATHDLS